MRTDYWIVEDSQVIEKTGHPLTHWNSVLDQFQAADKESNEVVAHLVTEHRLPRYWARTLTTRYQKGIR